MSDDQVPLSEHLARARRRDRRIRIVVIAVAAVVVVGLVTAFALTSARDQADHQAMLDEHAVAVQAFEDVWALQMEEPADREELDYKSPAGVAVFARGMTVPEDQMHNTALDEKRWIIAVVDLRDGYVFAQQYSRGDGRNDMHVFESVEAYEEWDWTMHAVGKPKIPSILSAYGANLMLAQSAHFAEHGAFANLGELTAYSQDTSNLAPDITPVDGWHVRTNGDAFGYLAAFTNQMTERVAFIPGYGTEAAVGTFDSLADYRAYIATAGDDHSAPSEASPLEEVRLLLDLDREDLVPVVPYPHL